MELEDIDTVIPGVVKAVNEDGTVDCKAVLRKVSSNGVFDLENPIMRNIPLMKLGGAGAEFSFPSNVDDPVLLVAFSRDASKWKKSDSPSLIPLSCSGLTLNDLVAVPLMKSSREGQSKIRVTKDGDIVLTPKSGRTICESDLLCKGKVWATGEVAALCQDVGGEFIDAMATHLSTHLHGTAVGPTTIPTAGT